MKWNEQPISTFCKTSSGGTPSRSRPEYYNGTIPWVKSGELRETVVLSASEHITEQAIKESSAKVIPAGALLVAMYGATIGRVAYLGMPTATNQAVCNIIPDASKADKQYLFYALRSKAKEWIGRGAGGAQPNISQKIIQETKIPLPPLEEQKRIAAILDKADAIRKKRKKAIELTDQFLRSAFLDMFGDPITNPNGWGEMILEDVADIQSGVTKGRKLNGKKTVAVPYMRVANVQDGYLKLDEIKDIEVLPGDVGKYALQMGDVLLTEGGDPDKLGRGAVWNEAVSPCIHQNHIFRVRPNRGFVLPDFLSALLGSSKGKKYFLRAAKQTTGIASINKTQLRGFPVTLPPLSLQHKYARLVEKNAANKLKLNERALLGDYLFHSTVQKAFQGEL